MNTISQSVLSTNLIQVPITIQSPDGYDPSSDSVAFAFVPYTYPVTEPDSGDWHAGSFATFPGPAYWAQILVGPALSGVSLAIGKWAGWVRITDSSAVPIAQPFILQVTP